MNQFKKLPLLLVAIAVVALLAVRIYVAQAPALQRAESDCSSGRFVLLNDKTRPEALAAILVSRGYVGTDEEASFIARHLIGRILEEGRPESIRGISNDKYGIELDSASFMRIAQCPYLLLRAESLAGGHRIAPDIRPTADAAVSKRYTVKIRNAEGGTFKDIVYLCVREHYHELVEQDGKIIDCHSADSVYAWIPVTAKTDIDLPIKDSHGQSRFFSVTPVERGYTFGSPRGTYQSGKVFKFVRNRAVLPIFSRETLKRMREDNSVFMRSSQEYRDKFVSIIALFAAFWILMFLLLAIIDRKRGGNSKMEILSVTALLSGLGVVNLFAVQNPLWGQLLGVSQFQKGFLLGGILLCVCSYVDWTSLFRYSRKAHLATGKGGIQGLWMAIAAIVISLLMLFGKSTGGAHLTLPMVPIQGSPIVKALIIGFIAVYFSTKGDLIEAYSRPGKLWKQTVLLISCIVFLFVFGLCNLALSDVGPYLVLTISVIFIFSLAAKETLTMLIWTGVFGALLLLGKQFDNYSILPFVIFALFTAIYSLYSYNRYQMVKLSPVLLCVVLLLAFHGGSLLEAAGLSDIAERVNGRSIISAHIYDNQIVGGSQIAQGIWGLARGGVVGMPDKGLSSTLPAGHTDMVYETLVENLGFLGGIAVLVCILAIIVMGLVIGVRNGTPFAFYLSSLIVLSLGIQTMLIVLGSLGIIPMTGIPLGFISYGSTALAIDMASIGILISLSRNNNYELETLCTRKFESMAKGQIWAFIALASIAIAATFYIAVISRDHYLIKPGKFIDKEGNRVVMLNPLIKATEDELRPGDIIDSKGRVMATTNEDGSRNYPFGDYTLFTLGDINTKILAGSSIRRPVGLNAEKLYESTIRGYSTNPIDLPIKTSKHYSAFLPDVRIDKEEVVRIEDFSSLLPMMKSPKEVHKWNASLEDRKVVLTTDAVLQVSLSKRLEQFVQRMRSQGKTTMRTRGEGVIMDAANGSLLCSSMFPVANQSILAELARTGATVYRDWAPGFQAYTDMDLALTPFAPGSFGKTLVTGAGLVRYSTDLADTDFNQMVYADEIVDVSLGEPTGSVSLRTAIVQSSNVYFIRLLNHYDLYDELAELYYSVGARWGYSTPYVLFPNMSITDKRSYTARIRQFGDNAVAKFARYEESGIRHRLIDAEYQPSWGQGEVSMSPLSMARYLGAIAMNGEMYYPRYCEADSVKVYRRLMSAEEAHVLQSCMKGQAAGRFGELSAYIGGKTGTPSRTDPSKGRHGSTNDAIYGFFIDGGATTAGHPLAIVIRLERVNDYSRLAIQMAKEVVIPVLRENGYLL